MTHSAHQYEPDIIILPSNPKKALESMGEIIDHLHYVYSVETEALENADAKTFMALQDTKILAARNYQAAIEQLLNRKEELSNTDVSLKDILSVKQKSFSELSRRNLEALARMQKSMERFGNTLRNAVVDAAKKQRPSGYTSIGTMSIDEAKRITTGSISQTA
jgi:hypothetical protein